MAHLPCLRFVKMSADCVFNIVSNLNDHGEPGTKQFNVAENRTELFSERNQTSY